MYRSKVEGLGDELAEVSNLRLIKPFEACRCYPRPTSKNDCLGVFVRRMQTNVEKQS